MSRLEQDANVTVTLSFVDVMTGPSHKKVQHHPETKMVGCHLTDVRLTRPNVQAFTF
jgi:hypothetical protein